MVPAAPQWLVPPGAPGATGCTGAGERAGNGGGPRLPGSSLPLPLERGRVRARECATARSLRSQRSAQETGALRLPAGRSALPACLKFPMFFRLDAKKFCANAPVLANA